MDIKDRYESKLQKTALSCDAFTTGYFVMGLLFFVLYASSFGGMLVMWFLPVALLLPFALLPLFYSLVHRVDILLFGRYHLAMPVSVFVSALFFVFAFCANGVSAEDACLIFFGVAVFTVSVAVYKYCSFSVRARLGGDGIIDPSLVYCGFSFLGGAAAIGAFFGFMYYDPATCYINTAYVMGGLNILAALVQYLTTYYDIPRLSGKRVQSVKSVFRSFYCGINKRVYFSALLFTSAFAVIVSLIFSFCIYMLDDIFIFAGVAGLLFVCFAVAEFVCIKLVKYRSMRLSAFNFVCVVISAALLTVVAATNISAEGIVACIMIAAAFCGVGGAVCARQTKLRLLAVKPRVTSGVVYMLIELTAFAAMAIAFVVATCVVNFGGAFEFIYGFAVSAALAVAAFALARKKSAYVANSPKLSYELITSETDGNSLPEAIPLTGEQDGSYYAESAKDKE